MTPAAACKSLRALSHLGLALALGFLAAPAMAQPGEMIETPANPTELPVEIEVETGIGSLKQEPLWKEFVQMLEDPYLAPINGSNQAPSLVVRRPRFPPPLVYGTGGAFETDPMPALNVWPVGYNFLTSQPMRAKYHEAGVIESDAEISWDNPGPLFDPDENVATNTTEPNNENVPIELRTKIGALVACTGGAHPFPPGPGRGVNPCDAVEDLAVDLYGADADEALLVADGFLVMHNPPGGNVRDRYGYSCDANSPGNSCQPDSRIPENGTVVAVPVVVGGTLYEGEVELGEFELEEVVELEAPVNEEHFIKGRRMAEDLGKALFWDMQVGSDGVQSCGSCHFHAGVDNRTKNQLNPNIDPELQVLSVAGSATTNVEVIASDFPFHQTSDHRSPAEPLFQSGNVTSDANDVMSSMGVSRFTQFTDVIVGPGALIPATDQTHPAVLAPDLGTPMDDPIAIMQGVRRVEPRNTPTMHAAAFNHDNFWDGRARFHFNGGSVFGQTDPFYHIYVNAIGAPLAEMTNPLDTEENIGTWWAGNANGNEDGETAPIRIKFSSLASQAVGPPLSDFEMAFAGRNWPKIGKKLLQDGVTPLANQLVARNDSRIGRWSNQGGSACAGLAPADQSGDGTTALGKPGLCISYPAMIRGAFRNRLWNQVNNAHLVGTSVPMDNSCDPGEEIELGGPEAATCDPFDGYVLEIANGAAVSTDTNQFTQMEANFSLLFALSVQAYESLLIPDDTPFDRFLDANPRAGFGIGQPGEQGVLFPTLIPGIVDVGSCPDGTIRNGVICLIPDNPATPEFDGFLQEELLGFDIFAGANLTAALEPGSERNPEVTITNESGNDITIAVGSNPFARTSRCMLCHLGPAQTDHSNTIAHGIIKGDAEFEFPVPPAVMDPLASEPGNCIFEDCMLPAPESPGIVAAVGGLVLAEEVAETAQDAVEVEPVNFNATGNLIERIIAAPDGFAFGDQGIYNVGLRPSSEDIGRGGDGAFGFPLALTALTLLNVAQEGYVLCDNDADFMAHPNACNMTNFNPMMGAGGGLFGETGSDQRINPGLEREPEVPTLPEYLAEWTNAVPAGELHPQIDEMAGYAPNTLTEPNGGPAIEFPENLFGADLHCGFFDPDEFGAGPPNFGWGPFPGVGDDLEDPFRNVCPNPQSGVPNNMGPENPGDLAVYVAGSLVAPIHGTWPFVNRLRRDGNFKAPQLRNVELTGPYFHTGSYLTLRQVTEFYLRGGDFPVTEAENRDQNMVRVDDQAFGFGTTKPVSNGGPIPNAFADALPDTNFQYDPMPDTDHPITPEPTYMTHDFAATSIVRYLLSLTDPRVSHRSQPFDQPEIFVPIDGTAPENTGGRTQLVGDPLFLQVPATGRPGQADKLRNFLGVSSTQLGSQTDCRSSGGTLCDHFDIK